MPKNNKKTQNKDFDFPIKQLASNEKPERDKSLNQVRKWLKSRKELDDEEVMKLWKALYFCMWMSDKPFVQQEIADNLAKLIHQVKPSDALIFLRGFYSTMEREWVSIDRNRLSKFLSLLRKTHEQSLHVAAQLGWRQEVLEPYFKELLSGPLNPNSTSGIIFQLLDIYLDEFYRVTKREHTGELLHRILYPIYELLATCTDKRIIERAKKNIFEALAENIKEQKEKEEKEDEEEEQEEEEEDLSDIRYWKRSFIVDANLIYNKLFEIASTPNISDHNRNVCYDLMKQFKPFTDASAIKNNNTGLFVPPPKSETDLKQLQEEEVKPKRKTGKNPFKKGGKRFKKKFQ